MAKAAKKATKRSAKSATKAKSRHVVQVFPAGEAPRVIEVDGPRPEPPPGTEWWTGDGTTELERDVAAANRAMAVGSLGRAASAWIRAGGSDGDPMAVAIVNVLHSMTLAVTRNDVEAIAKVKNAPDRWARAYASRVASGEPYRRASAEARELVTWTHERVKLASEDSRAFARGAAQALQFMVALAPSVRFPQTRIAAMTEKVEAVTRRRSYDSHALAIALLEGWGLSNAAARAALKTLE